MAHDPCHVSHQGHSLLRESTFVPSNWKVFNQNRAGKAHFVEHLSCHLLRSSRTLYPGFKPHQCHYVDQVCGSKWLSCHTGCQEGVASEVNLKNPWHTGRETCWQGVHPGFETQGRCHQKSNTGVSVAPQKGLMSLKFFKEKRSLKSRSQGYRFNLVCSIPDLQYPLLCGGAYIKLY